MKNLLLYKLGVFNACGLAGLVYMATTGALQFVYASDVSRLTWLITGLFAISTASTFWHGLAINKLARAPWRYSDAYRDVERLSAKTEHINDFNNSFVLLGLIGTVVGVMHIFQTLGSRPEFSQILTGTAIAFLATGVGAATALWNAWNFRMLSTELALLYQDVKP